MHDLQIAGAHTDKAIPPMACPQEIEVLPGINLNILDFFPEDNVAINVEAQSDRVEFAFVLSGEAESALVVDSKKSLFNADPETCIALYMPGAQGSFSIRRRRHARMFGLNLEAGRLKRMLGFEETANIGRLMRINKNAPLSPIMKGLAAQFFSCTKSGTARSLFLQGKAMELLAELVESILHDAGRVKNRERVVSLGLGDMRRIRRARAILTENMASPPRLAELSSMVGLNINKLKTGFHSVYEKTPYRCLHEDRMDKARHLLRSGDMNVSEVAWDVGYANIGHFSAAFSKYFGVKPKTLQLDFARKPPADVD